MSITKPITRLLLEWREGSEVALSELTPLLYDELRKLARSCLRRERSGHTLQPTALVHEAYLRLVDQDQQNWQSRSHFLGVAAHLMRMILVDWARRGLASKRGAGAQKVPLDDVAAVTFQRSEQLIALDDALRDLNDLDPRKRKIVEQRYFGGMTVQDIAESLGISTATVERDSRLAHAWLSRRLKGGPSVTGNIVVDNLFFRDGF